MNPDHLTDCSRADPVTAAGATGWAPSSRDVWARHGLAFLVSVGLALVWTYPLALHLATHIPGSAQGDGPVFVWNNWWMRTAIASPSARIFWTPLLFAPFGTSLVLNSHSALPSLVAATVFRPAGLVLATNLVLLTGLALNVFTAYLFAHALTKRRAASLLAGIVYGGSPFVMGHLLGHFNLVHLWVLPLCASCVWRALDSGRRVWAGAAGVTLAAAPYVDYYLAIYAAALAFLLLVSRTFTVHLVSNPSSGAWLRRTIAAIALASGAAAVTIALTGGTVFHIGDIRVLARRPTNLITVTWLGIVAYLLMTWAPRVRLVWKPWRPSRRALVCFTLPLLAVLPLAAAVARLWQSGGYVSPVYHWRSSPAGIDVATFLLGNPWHPLIGGWTRAQYERFGIDPIEQCGWLGVPAVVAIALAALWWRSIDGRRLAFCATMFLAWALGPWLTIAGSQTGVLLPAFALRWVPVVNNARMPGRALVVVYLVLGLLAAIALARRSRGSDRLMTLLLIALVTADYAAVPFPVSRAEVPAVYARISNIDGNVLELPMGIRDGFGETGRFDSQAMLNQTLHRRPILGGFVARLAPAIRDRYLANPVMRSLLSASTGQSIPASRMAVEGGIGRTALSEFGVTTVVLNRATAPAPLVEYVERVLPIVPFADDGQRVVYAVR